MKKVIKISVGTALVLLLLAAAYYLFPESSLPPNSSIDRIVVKKSERKMYVYSGEELLKTYSISLGFEPKGHKQYEGDGKTPVGTYTINDKNPNSSCYLNLGISYPNVGDKAAADRLGKPPGGDIKIHGLMNGFGYIGKFHRFTDWTAGCIAVTNDEMKELYHNVEVGTSIEILD